MSMGPWHALDLPPCTLAESPRYAHGQWVWLDIDGQVLYQLAQADLWAGPLKAALQQHTLPEQMGCVLPTANPEQWVLLGRSGLWLFANGLCTRLLPAPFDTTKHRFNDGRADPQGRIWISTLVDARSPATAALYCIENQQVALKVPNLIVGNGLAFTPRGDALFLSDTRHKTIWRYPYHQATGSLGEPKVIKHYTEGTARPDGACFTADGTYWVAVLEGHRLDCFSDDGRFLRSVPLPLAKPTMPCFGGPGLNTLLVTGAPATGEWRNQAGFENACLVACQTHHAGWPEAFAAV
ncbi:SMP-30/gluconolactonase/LRE family protein [Limnobacter sp.]|uniref:SMP-30/gluconolactonase/LRE family protein n=1 Tax=Limnobacter sp. TaxID=2003368 RepID=UPI003514CB3E